MKIHHLRNATALLSIGEHRLLLDPMLAEPGSMPGFKLFGGGRRPNPLVPLPPSGRAALDEATAVLVTHEHPDHLDRAGTRWIAARGLPVWASPMDARSLRKKGLDARELVDGALGMTVEIVPARHGRGLLGWLLGPVSGCFLAHPGEPSLLVTSDAVLTDALLDAVDRLRPDVILAPARALAVATFRVGMRPVSSIAPARILAISSGLGMLTLSTMSACPSISAALAAMEAPAST